MELVTNGVGVFQRIMGAVLEDGLQATFVYVDKVTIAGETKEDLEENKCNLETAVKKYNLEFNHDKTVEF